MTPGERAKWIEKRVRVDVETGCWVWQGCKDALGYGRTTGGTAHRRVWRMFGLEVGPKASGEVLHHRCEVRPCVNPDHLEVKQRGPHMAEHAAGWPRRTEAEWRQAQREASARWRAKRRAAGGCRWCLEPAVEGLGVCAEHRAKENARRRAQRAGGTRSADGCRG